MKLKKLTAVLLVSSMALSLTAVSYTHLPLWEKAGYTPPPKPAAPKKTAYAQADSEKKG